MEGACPMHFRSRLPQRRRLMISKTSSRPRSHADLTTLMQMSSHYGVSRFLTTTTTTILFCSTLYLKRKYSEQPTMFLISLKEHHPEKRFTSLSSDLLQVMQTRSTLILTLCMCLLTLTHLFDCPDIIYTPTLTRASVEPRSSSSRSDDLRSRIKAIEDKFFTDDLSGSSVSDFLKDYVEGNYKLPVSTNGIEGLPLVKRRGVDKEAKLKLSLLFLDLPKPPSNTSDAIDERFQSNPVLKELDKLETRFLPVFGVSGCGKTRSVIEVLCLQWGFYFNAVKDDFGSRDLSELADYIGKRTLENSEIANTIAARNITRLLFLSRLIILEHCLGVPNCHETFSSANWALLQVCPNTFRDVFMELFQKLYKEIRVYGTDEAELISIVRDKFESVRDMLIELDYPNFSSESKFRLVIDEAQLLADMKSESFESSSSLGIRRPMYVEC
ncbi:hypothetical protein BDF22DRAFT_94824 [Syncephalis plumigaleata]|nr:hypothetical protein BDF22DRAFT_94824 [Syncephalis plumigaleata]